MEPRSKMKKINPELECKNVDDNEDVEIDFEQKYAEGESFAILQYNLGCYYLFGYDVKRDEQKAVNCFHLAADCDYLSAHIALAICYLKGVGVKKAGKTAVKYFRQAVERGSHESKYAIGYIYYKGIGVSINYSEAAKWFIRYLEDAKSKNGDSNNFIHGRVTDNIMSAIEKMARHGDQRSFHYVDYD